MAKQSLKEAVQAVGLIDEPPPAKAAPVAPVEVKRDPASDAPCVIAESERAPVGLTRFRVRAPEHDTPTQYLLALRREDAEAHYRKCNELKPDVKLVVVQLPD